MLAITSLFLKYRTLKWGTFLGVQRLRIHSPSAGGTGLIPGWRRSCTARGMTKKKKQMGLPRSTV